MSCRKGKIQCFFNVSILFAVVKAEFYGSNPDKQQKPEEIIGVYSDLSAEKAIYT